MAYSDLIRESYPTLTGLVDRAESGDALDVKLHELRKDIRAALNQIQTNLEPQQEQGSSGRHSILCSNDVEGTIETSVGALYLEAGTLSNFRAFMGCQNPTHSAILKIYRLTGSTLIATLGNAASGLANRSISNLIIPANDWYYITLSCSTEAGIALLRGISWS